MKIQIPAILLILFFTFTLPLSFIDSTPPPYIPFRLYPVPALPYAEYSVVAGSSLDIPLQLEFFSVGTPIVQAYSDPMGSWIQMSAISLSAVPNGIKPFVLTLNVPASANNGEYGIILQGIFGGSLVWRWKIFVTVSGGQADAQTAHTRINHSNWIVGEDMPRLIYLPEKTGFPLNIWIRGIESNPRDLIVDWILYDSLGVIADLHTGHNIWAQPNEDRSFSAVVDAQAWYDGGIYNLKIWAKDRNTLQQLDYLEIPIVLACPPFGSFANADEELTFSITAPTTTTTTSATTLTTTSSTTTSTVTSTATSTTSTATTSTSTSTSTTTSTSTSSTTSITSTSTSASTSTSTSTATATQTTVTATRLPAVTRPSFVFLTPVGSVKTNGTFQVSGYIAQFDYTYLPSIFVKVTIQINGGEEIPLLVSQNLEYPTFWTVDEETGHRSGTRANGGAYAFSVTVSGLSSNSLPWIPHIVTLRLYDTYTQLGYPPMAFPIFVYVVN